MKKISIYENIPLESKLFQEDLVAWLDSWYAIFPGEKIADPDYWFEQAGYALSGLNWARMEKLGVKVDIPESERNMAIAKWWKKLHGKK